MLATERVLSNLESESVSRGASRRCVWSPVLLSGDGHTRRRRQAPRDEQSSSIQFAFLSDGNFCSTSIALLSDGNFFSTASSMY